MTSKFYTLFICLISLFGHTQSGEFATDRIILAFNDSIDLTELEQIRTIGPLEFLFATYAIESISVLDGHPSKHNKLNNRPLLVSFENDVPILSIIDQLKSTLLFRYAEPDYIGKGGGQAMSFFETIPNDALFDRQWSLKNEGTFSLAPSTSDADVDMELAWDITTGDPNLIVAVLDSGIRMQHPEFAGRLWTNSNEVSSGTDTDTNGFIDDNDGWDFANNDNNPTDDHGHGTNVSGIIFSNGNNGIGYTGVNWQSQLMPLKILDNNNSGFYSWWIAAMYYAVDNGAKILNMSVGGSSYSSGMEDAANYAFNNNVSIFVSMMNFDNDVPYYPAAYTNTIALGSSDPDDTRSSPFFWSAASGSNYGNHIDLIAPGNFIYGLASNSDTNYNIYWGGTSMASPLVAGIASLMLSIEPTLSVDQIRTILRSTAEDMVGDGDDIPGWDQYYGAGRANAFFALQQVLSNTDYTLNNFKLFPNPVGDEINIRTTEPLTITSYEITSILGKQISKANLINNNTIYSGELASGVYFIKLNTDQGSQIIKFIKQ